MPSTAVEIVIALTAKDAASAVLGDVGKKLDSLGTAGKLAKVGIGLATAGLGLAVTAGLDFVHAAADEEAGIARLAQAVKTNGGDWNALSGQIEGTIAAMEKTTAFSDGDMRDALSLLTAETGDATEAMNRLPIAMDFATGAGIDLTTASKLLGKVTDETVNVLGRYGIHVQKGADATEVLALVQQKFGGQAAAYAGTAEGAWKQFGNQMNNLKEDIGKTLLPTFTAFGKAAVDAIEKLRDWVSKPEIQAALKGIADFIGKAKDILVEMFGVITGLAPDAGGALTAALGPDAAKFIMGALATLREGVKAAMDAIVRAVDFVKEHWDFFGPAFAAIVAGIIIPAFVAWAIAAGTAAVATIVAMAPVLLALAAIGVAAGLLALAWNSNFLDIQGKTQAVVGFLQGLFDGFRLLVLNIFKGIVLGVVGFVNGIISVINGFIGAYDLLAGKLGLPLIGKIDLITPNLDAVNSAIDQVVRDRVARINVNVYEQAISGGGGTRQFALGTPFVPYTGPAIVHQGEAIIPAAQNPFAGGSFGGGTQVIQLVVDGRVLAEVVGDRFTQQRRMQALA